MHLLTLLKTRASNRVPSQACISVDHAGARRLLVRNTLFRDVFFLLFFSIFSLRWLFVFFHLPHAVVSTLLLLKFTGVSTFEFAVSNAQRRVIYYRCIEHRARHQIQHRANSAINFPSNELYCTHRDVIAALGLAQPIQLPHLFNEFPRSFILSIFNNYPCILDTLARSG